MTIVPSLTVIADAQGTVRVGWVGSGVLYARLERGLSAELGARYAQHVETVVARSSGVRYFIDAHTLTYYDLLARSAFVRLVLANRRKFASLVLLTWAEGIGPAARNVAATLGGSVDILVDALEFDVQLCAAAPLAKQVLDPKIQVPATTLVRR